MVFAFVFVNREATVAFLFFCGDEQHATDSVLCNNQIVPNPVTQGLSKPSVVWG